VPLIKVTEEWASALPPGEDVRGLRVLDRNGDPVGVVEDIFYDPDARQVREIEVRAGGVLGLGHRHFVVPRSWFRREGDVLRTDRTRDEIYRSPIPDSVEPALAPLIPPVHPHPWQREEEPPPGEDSSR
jgi:sporulation protein YlmC with PRC-barrel domain